MLAELAILLVLSFSLTARMLRDKKEGDFANSRPSQ
jgi:hypothetical protein